MTVTYDDILKGFVDPSRFDPIAPPVPKLAEFPDVDIGGIMVLGSYPQGFNGELAPIVWRPLHTHDDGTVTFISEYGLDAIPFNNEHKPVTWEDCSLRKWLNNDFCLTAFADCELNRIVADERGDKVSLLDIVEAQRYFSSNEDRKCRPTDYAKWKGAACLRGGDSCWWWIRPRSLVGPLHSIIVDGSGQIDWDYDVDTERITVRPVIRVRA